MTGPTEKTQVLVVGGGPAGSAAAWHLASQGIGVTLVDRARFPRGKACSEYISPEGTRLLQLMGALPALEAPGVSAQLHGMQVHAPSGAVIHGEFVGRHGFRAFRPYGLGVRRETLDALLLDRARAAGVRVVESAKVEALHTDGDARQPRVTGVRLREGGETRDLRASLVIGADGLRSTIAARLGLVHRGRWPRRLAIVTHYRGVAGIGALGEMHVEANGYFGLADVGGGQTNVALVIPRAHAGEMQHDPAAYLEEWIASRPALRRRFAAATCTDTVRVTGPFASHARRPWAPGAMLTGDAADFFDPFTGEGIFAALRGGELLAPFAIDALRALERAPSLRTSAGDVPALQAYAKERTRVFAGKWRVERLIGAAVGSPMLMNHAARLLGRDRDLADLLVGVTGDFVPPSAVLNPRVLLRLVLPRAGGSASPSPALHVHRR